MDHVDGSGGVDFSRVSDSDSCRGDLQIGGQVRNDSAVGVETQEAVVCDWQSTSVTFPGLAVFDSLRCVGWTSCEYRGQKFVHCCSLSTRLTLTHAISLCPGRLHDPISTRSREAKLHAHIMAHADIDPIIPQPPFLQECRPPVEAMLLCQVVWLDLWRYQRRSVDPFAEMSITGIRNARPHDPFAHTSKQAPFESGALPFYTSTRIAQDSERQGKK
jgi:hypothetical protein